MENVDGKIIIGSFGGEVYVDNTEEVIIPEKDYPLTVWVENCGEILEDLSESDSTDIRVLFGIFFCPREVCSINPQTGAEEKTYTVDMDLEEDKTTGLCFDIFTKLFEKLKENDLVAEYYLNEMECLIEAFHPDYKVLERITPLINRTHFGLGFWMGNVPNTQQVTNDEFNFLIEVQVILNELRNEFPILKDEKLEMQYHIECKFNN